MSVALHQHTLVPGSSPSFCDGRQLSEVEQAWLWTLLQHAPQCSRRALLAQAAQYQIWPRVTLRQINRWRAQWQRSRGKGRPAQRSMLLPGSVEGAVVGVTPRLSLVGIPLFARRLDQQGALPQW